MEDEPTQIRGEERVSSFTTSYPSTHYERVPPPPSSFEYALGVDWKTAVFIVTLALLIQAFTLGLVLITWWVIG